MAIKYLFLWFLVSSLTLFGYTPVTIQSRAQIFKQIANPTKDQLHSFLKQLFLNATKGDELAVRSGLYEVGKNNRPYFYLFRTGDFSPSSAEQFAKFLVERYKGSQVRIGSIGFLTIAGTEEIGGNDLVSFSPLYVYKKNGDIETTDIYTNDYFIFEQNKPILWISTMFQS